LGAKDIHINLDFRSGLPIYVQIMEQIRKMVASGELQLGDQLPTVRQLATDLRINWNTVARAYKLLDEAGVISTQQGRGTYIWEKPTEEMTNQLRQQALEALTRRFLSEASRLGCDPKDVTELFDRYMNSWKSGRAPDEEN
jgi:GntR family transcriptional regulator